MYILKKMTRQNVYLLTVYNGSSRKVGVMNEYII
jgi:hypothetical protein